MNTVESLSVKEGVRKGILPNELAFQAVQRELLVHAIIDDKAPIMGPFMYSRIVDDPTTKWSGKPVFVVHDHGTGEFGVAFTSNSEAFEIFAGYRDPHWTDDYTHENLDCMEERRIEDQDDSDIRFEIHRLQHYVEGEDHAMRDFALGEITKLRTVLRRRERGLSSF